MTDIKIALVGQPNTGKSCLLNSLTGARAIVSNYPGTTVEIIRGRINLDKSRLEIIDTPGIYSISDVSDEERVTERVIFEKDIDGVVVLLDSTALERGLYLALQIIEAGIASVAALNFVEEAQKKGIHIDPKKLEAILGVPVVQINPLTGKGIRELLEKVLHIKDIPSAPFMVGYDDHIEKAIQIISEGLAINLPFHRRFIAIRILEDDSDFFKFLTDKKFLNEATDVLSQHHNVQRDICITRHGEASFISHLVSAIVSGGRFISFGDRIDSILFHPFIGPLCILVFFIFIFGILLLIGRWLQGLLMTGAERYLISPLFTNTQGILSSIFTQGLYGLVAGVAIALPYVFLFYIFLGLLEDIGILPRFILGIERSMRRLDLPGRSFIPLILGLGCSVPAIRATRILSDKKEKKETSLLFACIPCSSRTAIIMGITGFYGGSFLALSVYFTMGVSFLIFSFMVKRTLKVVPMPLILEMPSYRKPVLKNVISKGWIRMKDFVYIVVPLLVAGGALYGLLSGLGLTSFLIKPFMPLTVNWLGLPPETIIPLVYGFIQKDLTAGMLVAVLGPDINSFLDPLQLYTFGIACSIQIPCVVAFGMLLRELGFRTVALITIISVVYGLLIAGAIWRLLSWHF